MNIDYLRNSLRDFLLHNFIEKWNDVHNHKEQKTKDIKE